MAEVNERLAELLDGKIPNEIWHGNGMWYPEHLTPIGAGLTLYMEVANPRHASIRLKTESKSRPGFFYVQYFATEEAMLGTFADMKRRRPQ